MNRMVDNLKRIEDRNSNLELFRIITMFYIIAHHYVVHSGLTDVVINSALSIKTVFIAIWGMWGKTGINCFVMITGYFMCKSKISFSKLLKLVLEIIFYNVMLYGIFVFSGYETISIKGIYHALWPFKSIDNSFVRCFPFFYLTIPFLNLLITNLSKKMHLYLIALCIFIYTILPSILRIEITFNYITWFAIIYFIASFIRLHPDITLFNNKKLSFMVAMISIVISMLSVVGLMIVTRKFGLHKTPYHFVADSNKILAVVTAVALFIYFKNINIKKNKFINIMVASTFGVLLIHDNGQAIRQWLWVDTLNNVGQFSMSFGNVFSHAIVSVLVVFIICTVIDYIRINTLEKLVFKGIDKIRRVKTK